VRGGGIGGLPAGECAYLGGYLPPGDRTVKIESLGTKNASSSGYAVDLDAIDQVGVLK
jgi:hypothetical protein